MPIEVILHDNPSKDDLKVIYNGLLAFNSKICGAPDDKPFVALLHDTDTDATLGGMHSVSFYSWLYVTMLFVPERLRNQGYGKKLLEQAETYARSLGSHGIWLDTYSFQAPGFYENAGFEKFGELPNLPPGHTRIFYRKILS